MKPETLFPRMTPDEYLAWERDQATKHEYVDGYVFAMAGGTPRHNALAVRISGALGAATSGCTTFSSDQRIGVRVSRYRYPDVSVVCGRMELREGTRDVVTNPAVLVEVLSSSTELEDRSEKWEDYRRLPSLTDYLLVAQSQVLIELYQREADGRWTYREHRAGDRVRLSNGVELVVDELYLGMMDVPGEDLLDNAVTER